MKTRGQLEDRLLSDCGQREQKLVSRFLNFVPGAGSSGSEFS